MRIYRRGQSWYLDFCHEGRRVRQLIRGARTKTEAQAALSAVKTDILRGQYNFRSENRILFEEFAEIYLEKYSIPNKRSWRRDITSVKALLPHFKGISLSKISPFLIEGYKLKRKGEVEVSTINRELAFLKHIFTKAIDWGYVLGNENPVKRVKLFNEQNRKRERILSQEELTALLSNCRTPLKETVLLALNTGMRIGEIMALRWEEVNLADSYILIKNSKNGKSRKVPINGVARCALNSLQDRAGSLEFVFPNYTTGSFTKYPRKAFQNACRRAGITGFRIHDLRHQAATAMVQSGVDLHTVSKILGHSTVKLTERYSHPEFDHTMDAVKKLESSFGQNKTGDGTILAQQELPNAASARN